MNSKAKENREKIEQIKTELSLGIISYEEAKKKAKPIIEGINKVAKDLAQKYGVKPRYVDFNSLMR